MDTGIVAISGLPTSSKPGPPKLNGFIGTGVEPKTLKSPTNGFVVNAVISNVINVRASDNVLNTPSGGSSRTEQCANSVAVPSDSPSTSLGAGDSNNNVDGSDGTAGEKKERKFRPRRRRFRYIIVNIDQVNNIF
ncbi:hypothetical protein LOTGIDRAFT_166684 [Lottia gigantea]|uniref:Uncharacterized protein n=1 Tax=Lottia gigantea TaxID=225164 RepID=V4A0Z4_LOTGI|nr:hypothetical protein LOTGIDRAFT_166684 [Lottia gigantea]ESO86951.1 hypothetical protein LOTGIDRAFT_166684 [Lottia gigantea]